MGRRWFACAVLMAACGDDTGPGTNPHTFDALPDAPALDAPAQPDAPAHDGGPDAPPPTCGPSSVQLLPAGGEASAPAPSGSGQFSGTCGGAGPEAIYLLTTSQLLASLTVTTDLPQTTMDPILYVRATCDQSQTELGCLVGRGAVTVANAAAGDYFIFVDTGSATASGIFALRVTGIIPENAPCDPADREFTCAGGHVCVERTPGQGTRCAVAACANGIDDDNDNHTDFPFDPGCTSPEDDDETDDCPSGPNCPQCGNGMDDDGDGHIDYPADPGCSSASDPSEANVCSSGVAVGELDASGQATGDTTGGADHYQGVCASFVTSGFDQVVHYRVDRPTRSITATVDAPGLASAAFIYIRKNDCGSSAAQVSCAGPSLVARARADSLVVGDDLFFIVDSLAPLDAGTWALQADVALERGAACNPAEAWRHCASGLKCAANLCVPTQCADGTDNDADGKIDYPFDPGCATADDDSELDDCPSGPNCPQCGNGVDDDGDGRIDYPADPGCLEAADASEVDDCPGTPITDITATGAASGATGGSANMYTPSCTTSTAPERVFRYRLAQPVSTLTASLCGSGYDTALYVRYAACSSADVGCDDDSCGMPIPTQSQVTLQNPAAGDYFIFVDGYMNHSGPFTLTVVTTP